MISQHEQQLRDICKAFRMIEKTAKEISPGCQILCRGRDKYLGGQIVMPNQFLGFSKLEGNPNYPGSDVVMLCTAIEVRIVGQQIVCKLLGPDKVIKSCAVLDSETVLLLDTTNVRS
jgi:hypothetical protein